MDDLTEIAKKYQTDKSDNGYTQFYDSIFSEHRNMFTKICEIGIKYGGSISMWLDYFQNADVYGIDALEKEFGCLPKHERAFGFFGNTRIRDDIKKFNVECGDDFDFILDDGCHQTSAQQIAFGSFFPMVKSGGFYIIEDITCCLDPHYAKEDGSDAILPAVIELAETGKLGKSAIYIEEDEKRYIEENFDSCRFFSQCGNYFQRGVAGTAVIKKI